MLGQETAIQAKLAVWQRINAEILQQMRMLDFWLMFILSLLIAMIGASQFEQLRGFSVGAALLGAAATVWIGRADVLVHRPVSAVKQIEMELEHDLAYGFKGWERSFKPRLKIGVKILILLDPLAGLFLTGTFFYANNAAYQYLVSTGSTYATSFWWACTVLHFIGWAIIAAAKPLAE